MDTQRQVIYGLTWPSGQMHACQVKPPKNGPRITLVGLTSSVLQGVPRFFDVLRDGRVFMCDGATGDILVYVPGDYEGEFKAPEHAKVGLTSPGRLNRPIGLVTPTRPERLKNPSQLRRTQRYNNWWFWGARSPDGMRIYATAGRRGQIFEVDGTAGLFGRVIDHPHAKPWSGFGTGWSGAMVEIMTFGKNGLLYYTGDEHLLSYDPERGEIRDWGFMVIKGEPETRVSKRGCGLSSVADDGTIYSTGFRRGRQLERHEITQELLEVYGDGPVYETHYGLFWFKPSGLQKSKLQYTERRRKRRR
jgi:hypothetical protein